MNKQEFSEALKIAQSNVSLEHVDDSNLFGCGLESFQPVHCSKEQVAKLIRWQALYLNGNWDWEEIDTVAYIGRRKFLIVA